MTQGQYKDPMQNDLPAFPCHEIESQSNFNLQVSLLHVSCDQVTYEIVFL